MPYQNKLTKEEAYELLQQGYNYLDIVKYSITELPPTPGRDAALKGVEKVEEGLDRIEQEQE